MSNVLHLASVNLKILRVNDVTCYISPLHWVGGNMGNKLYQSPDSYQHVAKDLSNPAIYTYMLRSAIRRSGPWLIVPEAASNVLGLGAS